ncbi:MAG: hypothetical protein KKF48_01705 [Nanoarchaeota archaeon]|nr:hypothetical protein [Nanoarchaeota archaeon]MBU1027736.1 hypothetical protein [Nanoarchaeota archaeon]
MDNDKLEKELEVEELEEISEEINEEDSDIQRDENQFQSFMQSSGQIQRENKNISPVLEKNEIFQETPSLEENFSTQIQDEEKPTKMNYIINEPKYSSVSRRTSDEEGYEKVFEPPVLKARETFNKILRHNFLDPRLRNINTDNEFNFDFPNIEPVRTRTDLPFEDKKKYEEFMP